MPFESPRLSHPAFRFELRPHDAPSAKALQEAAAESTDHICPWMAWLHEGYTLKEAQEWTAHAMKAWRENTEYHFLIYDRNDGKLTGCCGLNQINRKDMVCNLGYWVRASKLRLGAATQAVALLKGWAFAVPRLNRLEIVVAKDNAASRAVAAKSGAIYEGLQRARMRVGDKVHDAHMYALIRPGMTSASQAYGD